MNLPATNGARASRSWRPANLGARRIGVAATTALGTLVLALWFLHLAGHSAPPVLARTAVVLLLASAATVSLWQAGRAWNSKRTDLRLLLGLLVLAAAVRFVGIDHEVEERYYLDEGTYYKHATQINDGEVLRTRFVYPHLLYYVYAFVLWLASLFPAGVRGLTSYVFDVTEPIAIQWLLMRSTVAVLGVASVVPVFRLGQWLQGNLAAVLGSLLYVFSTLINDGSHLLIADAPSAMLATWALWLTTRVVPRERARDYALAGVFTGLAAATKYPAGVVAVALGATWLACRWRSRNWSWGLLWGGLAALASFVAVMPSLLFFPTEAFTGAQGIFFGVRQYAGGGWLGVMPRSNFRYYLAQLEDGFGWPVLVLGVVGLGLLLRPTHLPRARGRLLWLLPYPVAYFVLVTSMNMVVKRNIYPLVPALAAILGLGLASAYLFVLAGSGRSPSPARRAPGSPLRVSNPAIENLTCKIKFWGSRLLGRSDVATGAVRSNQRSDRLSRVAIVAVAAAALLAVALFLPVYRTTVQTVALANPGTRVEAREWIRDHVAQGAHVVKESYTPGLSEHEYRIRQTRFVPRVGLDLLRSEDVDLIVVASAAYQRFFGDDTFREDHVASRQTYEALFRDHEELFDLSPSNLRTGPRVRVFRGGPLHPTYATSAELGAASAFVPDPGMIDQGADASGGDGLPPEVVRFTHEGQWCSFKLFLATGSYDVTITGSGTKRGTLLAETLERRKIADLEIVDGTAQWSLATAQKVFLKVWLPPGAEIRQLSLRRRQS